MATFREKSPDVPALIGEVAVNRVNADPAQRVAYFFQQAEASGVPCLWWEDGYADSFSMYVIKEQRWERPELLAAIQEQIAEPLRLTVSVYDKDYFLTSTLNGSCTVVAAACGRDEQFLGCSVARRAPGETRLALVLDLPDCPDGYQVKVFFLESVCAPACIPLERSSGR